MKDCQRQQGTSYPFHPPQTQRQGQSVARVGYYHLFLVVIANPSNVVEQKYQQGRAPCFLRQMILIRITMKIRIHFQCYHRLLLPRLPRRTETRGSISPFLRPSLPYSLGYSVADSHDGVNSLYQMLEHYCGKNIELCITFCGCITYITLLGTNNVLGANNEIC